MKILLDTHIILWAISDDLKLPEEAKKLILDMSSKVFYSTASIWEVAIKHRAHPEHMQISGKELSFYCQSAGYEMLPIIDEHVYALETLERSEYAPKHNDPFDRIMLAQAKAEKMLFLTHDSLIPYYNESNILFV